MARPRKQDQFSTLPDNDCDERVVHFDAVRLARKTQPAPEDLVELSALLGLMADPTRLRIVAALDATELCVCDLSAVVGISESAVSHQLRQMRELDVVRARRDGRRVFYSLNDEHVMSIYRQARDHVGHGHPAEAAG
jgi:ArsR family transcriptional regulator